MATSGRWFRHYIGLHSDTKFGAVARRARSTADRAVFVYIAALESACERNEAGAYSVSADGLAVVCGCETPIIKRILKELVVAGLLTKTHVAKWSDRQFESDSSRERVKRWRDKHRKKPTVAEENGSAGVTLQKQLVAAPEAEAEADTELANATLRTRDRTRSDLDSLEGDLREAAGAVNDPSPGLLDLSPILGLLDAGYDIRQEILPAIKVKAATMRRPARSWAYFVGAVQDFRTRRQAASVAPRLRVVTGTEPPVPPSRETEVPAFNNQVVSALSRMAQREDV